MIVSGDSTFSGSGGVAEFAASSWILSGPVRLEGGGVFVISGSVTFSGSISANLPTTLVLLDSFIASGTIASNVAVTRSRPGPTTAAPAPAAVPSAPILGIATRAVVAPGGVLNPGFVVGGSVARRVMVRAVGPGLAQFNVSGFMVNPSFRVFNGSGVEIASNDDHGGLTAAVAGALGAFPLPSASRDAALVLSLAPGSYSAVIRGGAGEGGDVLAEVYFVD